MSTVEDCLDEVLLSTISVQSPLSSLFRPKKAMFKLNGACRRVGAVAKDELIRLDIKTGMGNAVIDKLTLNPIEQITASVIRQRNRKMPTRAHANKNRKTQIDVWNPDDYIVVEGTSDKQVCFEPSNNLCSSLSSSQFTATIPAWSLESDFEKVSADKAYFTIDVYPFQCIRQKVGLAGQASPKAQRSTHNFSLSPVSMSSSSFASSQSAVPISAWSIDSNCGETEVDVTIEEYPFQCTRIAAQTSLRAQTPSQNFSLSPVSMSSSFATSQSASLIPAWSIDSDDVNEVDLTIEEYPSYCVQKEVDHLATETSPKAEKPTHKFSLLPMSRSNISFAKRQSNTPIPLLSIDIDCGKVDSEPNAAIQEYSFQGIRQKVGLASQTSPKVLKPSHNFSLSPESMSSSFASSHCTVPILAWSIDSDGEEAGDDDEVNVTIEECPFLCTRKEVAGIAAQNSPGARKPSHNFSSSPVPFSSFATSRSTSPVPARSDDDDEADVTVKEHPLQCLRNSYVFDEKLLKLGTPSNNLSWSSESTDNTFLGMWSTSFVPAWSRSEGDLKIDGDETDFSVCENSFRLFRREDVTLLAAQ